MGLLRAGGRTLNCFMPCGPGATGRYWVGCPANSTFMVGGARGAACSAAAQDGHPSPQNRHVCSSLGIKGRGNVSRVKSHSIEHQCMHVLQ